MSTTTELLSGKLLEVINQIQLQVIAKAPAALDMALSVTRINCIINIGYFITYLLLTIISITISYKCYKNFEINKKEIQIPVALFSIMFAGLFSIGVCGYFNLWNILGIFEPKLYLAHLVMAKFLG